MQSLRGPALITAAHERLFRLGPPISAALAVSAAANLPRNVARQAGGSSFPHDRPLREHHPRIVGTPAACQPSWAWVCTRTIALRFEGFACDTITAGEARWEPAGQQAQADAVLWAIGRVQPNTEWLHANCLTRTAVCRRHREPWVPAARGLRDRRWPPPIRCAPASQPRRRAAGPQHPRRTCRYCCDLPRAAPPVGSVIGPVRRVEVVRPGRTWVPDTGLAGAEECFHAVDRPSAVSTAACGEPAARWRPGQPSAGARRREAVESSSHGRTGALGPRDPVDGALRQIVPSRDRAGDDVPGDGSHCKAADIAAAPTTSRHSRPTVLAAGPRAGVHAVWHRSMNRR